MNFQNKNIKNIGNIAFARPVHKNDYRSLTDQVPTTNTVSISSNDPVPMTNTGSITSSNLEPQPLVEIDYETDRLEEFMKVTERFLSENGPEPPTDRVIREINADPMKLAILPRDFEKTAGWQMLVLRALLKDGLAIQCIIPRHYNERTLSLILFYCGEAVKQNGMALEHMGPLQDVLHLVELAVNQNPKAIVFASDNVKRQLLKEYFYHSLNPLGYYSNRRLLKNNTILPLLYYIKRRESDNIGEKEELQTDIDDVITNLNENKRKLNQYKKLINYKNPPNNMNSMKKDRFPSGF